ncbi:thiamine pyrophosphate-binding protein [Streptomyces sp. M19]
MPEDSQDLISGGHLVAKALKAEGVDVIYTLCGGHIIDIYDGCADEGIDVIDVRHEQVAAHAADGYARVTGKPGCAVVTAGPGTTDAVTGVANAFRAESPMLLIGGQGAHSQHKMGSLQDLPHVDMMTPITSSRRPSGHRPRGRHGLDGLPRVLPRGARPSFLEIPRDVLDAKVPAASARVPEPGATGLHRSAGDPEAIEKLADLLVAAEKPAVLLGSQVWTTRGTDAAVELVRALNIPAYMNGAGRGTLPPGDPHHFQLSRRYAFANADVIVIVGTPFDFRMGYGRRLSKDATVVQIDLDYRTVGKNRDVDLGIVGDAGLVLSAVAQAASGRIDGARAAQGVAGGAARRRAGGGGQTAAEPALRRLADPPVPPGQRDQRLPHRGLDLHRRRGDIVTFSGQVVQPKSPGHWMDPGPLGTLGVGVPFVMAAKQARPDKEVVALFGDGAFSLTGWDFETLVRFDLPFVGVVGNNSSMNQIRYGQRAKYGDARSGSATPSATCPTTSSRGCSAATARRSATRRNRPGAAPRPRVRQAVADQRLGRPRRVRPGTVNQTMYK